MLAKNQYRVRTLKLEIDLSALALVRRYGWTFIFNAYYTAIGLNQIDDNIIISMDTVFNSILGVRKFDPREV